MVNNMNINVLIKKICKMNLKEFALKYGIYIGFVIIFISFSIADPKFLTLNNFINILDQYSYYMICAIGMTFVILVGGVDLSNGCMIAFAGVIGATIMVNTRNVLLGCTVILLLSIAGGVINGLSIVKIGMPAFIATLALGNIFRGTAFTYTMAKTVSGLPKKFTQFSWSKTFGIPNTILLLVIIFIIAYYLLTFTAYGKKLYAIGDNPKASKVMGLNVDWVTISAYTICGICTGISTLILTSYMATARPAVAENLSLECIAAVIIGGASVKGGEGKVTGTLIGAFIFAMVKNGLNLMGLSYFYQLIASGIIIYIASAVDRMKEKAGY